MLWINSDRVLREVEKGTIAHEKQSVICRSIEIWDKMGCFLNKFTAFDIFKIAQFSPSGEHL